MSKSFWSKVDPRLWGRRGCKNRSFLRTFRKFNQRFVWLLIRVEKSRRKIFLFEKNTNYSIEIVVMDSSIFNLERVEFDVALSTIFLTKIKYPITNVEPLCFHSSIGNSGGRKKMLERNGNRGREEKDNNPVQSPDRSRNIITLTI